MALNTRTKPKGSNKRRPRPEIVLPTTAKAKRPQGKKGPRRRDTRTPKPGIASTLGPSMKALARHMATVSVTVSRALEWASPRAVAFFLSALTSGLEIGRACAGFTWRRRIELFRASHRLLWWGALGLLVFVGRHFLGGFGPEQIVDHADRLFVAGLVACVFIVVFAAERRMKAAAFALGLGHGGFALIALSIA